MNALDTTLPMPQHSGGAVYGPRAMDCGSVATPAPRWCIVAHEWGQHDLAVAAIRDLRDHRGDEIGPQVYSPKVRVLVQRRGAPAARQIVPAWPGYLLCLIPPDDWHHLRRARGVAEVLGRVGDRQSPAWLPEADVGRLLAMTSACGVIEEWSVPEALPPITVGAEVRITGGALGGHVARVQLSTAERVAVLMNMMGREVRATVERRYVEVVA